MTRQEWGKATALSIIVIYRICAGLREFFRAETR